MKRKLLLIDIASLNKNGKLYGHGLNVAKNYTEVLKNYFDCYVVGGKVYKEYFQQYIRLPFSFSFHENGFIKNIKGLTNVLVSLLLKADIYIFQSQYNIPILACLKFFPFLVKNKKIYLIMYNDPINNPIYPTEKKWFMSAQDRIYGIITCNVEWTNSLNCKVINLPDYLPENNYIEKKQSHQYDFAVLGTISEWKNCEMVIEAINKTDYTCLIAGNFEDKERKDKMCEIAGERVTILDEYLSTEKYFDLFSKTSCIVLPYNKEYYNNKSSGVVLESLYRKIPVIAPNINSFKFVAEQGVGWLYDDNISEVLEGYAKSIDEKEKNIEQFISKMENKVENEIKKMKK